ncbi:hypothetical protein [Streptomyces chrestomyceticus]
MPVRPPRALLRATLPTALLAATLLTANLPAAGPPAHAMPPARVMPSTHPATAAVLADSAPAAAAYVATPDPATRDEPPPHLADTSSPGAPRIGAAALALLSAGALLVATARRLRRR